MRYDALEYHIIVPDLENRTNAIANFSMLCNSGHNDNKHPDFGFRITVVLRVLNCI
jgi:hypothetical protein